VLLSASTRDVLVRDANSGHWLVGVSDGSEFTEDQSDIQKAYWNTAVDWEFHQGDFDGDGLTDVVGRNPDGVDGHWWTGLGDNNLTPQYPTLIGSGKTFARGDTFKGDFNGDNNTDLAMITASGEWTIGYSTGTGFTEVTSVTWSQADGWNDIQVGDFNGDGRSDIAARKDSGMWMISFGQASQGGVSAPANQFSWSNTAGYHSTRVGDFDGDGTHEIMSMQQNGQWWMADFDAAPGMKSVYRGAWGTDPYKPWQSILVADFDGDGTDDILGVQYVTKANPSQEFRQFWVKTGLDSSSHTNTHWGNYFRYDLDGITVGDFNNDGKADLASLMGNNDKWHVAAANETEIPVVDGNGAPVLDENGVQIVEIEWDFDSPNVYADWSPTVPDTFGVTTANLNPDPSDTGPLPPEYLDQGSTAGNALPTLEFIVEQPNARSFNSTQWVTFSLDIRDSTPSFEDYWWEVRIDGEFNDSSYPDIGTTQLIPGYEIVDYGYGAISYGTHVFTARVYEPNGNGGWSSEYVEKSVTLTVELTAPEFDSDGEGYDEYGAIDPLEDTYDPDEYHFQVIGNENYEYIGFYVLAETSQNDSVTYEMVDNWDGWWIDPDTGFLGIDGASLNRDYEIQIRARSVLDPTKTDDATVFIVMQNPVQMTGTLTVKSSSVKDITESRLSEDFRYADVLVNSNNPRIRAEVITKAMVEIDDPSLSQIFRMEHHQGARWRLRLDRPDLINLEESEYTIPLKLTLVGSQEVLDTATISISVSDEIQVSSDIHTLDPVIISDDTIPNLSGMTFPEVRTAVKIHLEELLNNSAELVHGLENGYSTFDIKDFPADMPIGLTTYAVGYTNGAELVNGVANYSGVYLSVQPYMVVIRDDSDYRYNVAELSTGRVDDLVGPTTTTEHENWHIRGPSDDLLFELKEGIAGKVKSSEYRLAPGLLAGLYQAADEARHLIDQLPPTATDPNQEIEHVFEQVYTSPPARTKIGIYLSWHSKRKTDLEGKFFYVLKTGWEEPEWQHE